LKTWLNVPFKDRDTAKTLGARWSPGNKRWYVENVENISAFMRWIPEHLTKPVGHTQPKEKPPCYGDTLRKAAGVKQKKRKPKRSPTG
jgi:ribonuclease HI